MQSAEKCDIVFDVSKEQFKSPLLEDKYLTSGKKSNDALMGFCFKAKTHDARLLRSTLPAQEAPSTTQPEKA